MKKYYSEKLTPLRRAIVEIAFIIFLFYSNLLMGEFTNSGPGHTLGLWWAVKNIFTVSTGIIALASGIIGYLVFEFLRNRI